MNVVHEDVKQCVENELQHAVSVFGLHHSWHEKAAVVGEELEECCEEMENLVDSMKFAWKQTRGNETDYIKEQAYNGVYDAAIRLAIEAIQVACTAQKGIENDEPTIDAQPVKRGRWSECWRDPERNVIAVICMACGDASLTYLPKRDLAVEDVPKKICVQMPYCPKCGAYMRGEKDERVD